MSGIEIGLTEAVFRSWTTRGISLFCLGALFPAVVLSSDQIDRMHPLWLLVVGGAIIGITIMLPVVSWSKAPDKGLFVSYSLTVFLALVTWIPAWGVGNGWEGVPWVWSLLPTSILAFGVGAGAMRALPYGVVVSAVFWWLRIQPEGGSASPLYALLDAGNLALPSMAILLVGKLLLKQAVGLDAARAEAERVQEVDSIEGRLLKERARLDAIVHDEIMTTLVAAASAVPGDEVHVEEQAQHALDVLEQAGIPVAAGGLVSAEQLVEIIESLVSEIDPDIRVDFQVQVARSFPIRVVRSVSRAAREAVWNAHRHACTRAISVFVSVDAVGIEVLVRDEGVGFDPKAISDSRLGIRLSLQNRMANVGGEAKITSGLGAGTTVNLTWTDDDLLQPHPPSMLNLDTVIISLLLWTTMVFEMAMAVVALNTQRSRLPGVVEGKYFLGMALAVAALLVANPRRAFQRLGVPRAVVSVVLMVLGVLLGLALTDHIQWSTHLLWAPGLSAVVFFALLLRRQLLVPWLGTIVVLGLVLVSVPLRSWDIEVLLLTPLVSSMVVGSIAFRWVDSVEAMMLVEEAKSAEASRARADRTAMIVMREVWLAELEDSVIPTLERIATVLPEFSVVERRELLTLEAQLRDAIKARNLMSPSVALLVSDARRRGIEVTLVDNRGSSLPPAARTVALQHIESFVGMRQVKRIVARTAPEGYSEAVTVVCSFVEGDSKLIRISGDGEALET